MILWILNHFATHDKCPGGTRHYDLGRYLKKLYNVDTYIFSSYFNYFLKDNCPLVKFPKSKGLIENYEGINFVWIPTIEYKKNDFKRLLNFLSYSVNSVRLAENLEKVGKIEKPDIIIGSSVHILAVMASYILSLKYKVPFVMEVRDLWPDALKDRVKGLFGILLLGALRIFVKFLYLKADLILSPLENAHLLLSSRYGIRRDKFVWVSNGVDLERFENVDQRERDKRKFLVIFVGAFVFANYIETLIKAAQILQNKNYPIYFELYGDGNYRPFIENLIRKLGLKNIKIFSPLPKREIPQVLKNADVLWFGLRSREIYKYGISLNKMFDYLAAGKPIVFSGDLKDTPVEKSGSGYVVSSNNSNELADILIKLYNMPEEKRLEIGRKGVEYVKNNFSFEILSRKLYHALDNLIRSRSLK